MDNQNNEKSKEVSELEEEIHSEEVLSDEDGVCKWSINENQEVVLECSKPITNAKLSKHELDMMQGLTGLVPI